MEVGFYHPDNGYWQTTGYPQEDIANTYPVGTVEVPLKPGPDYDYVDGEWINVLVEPTIEDIKQEAGRRILAICPEWKQRNLTARAAELAMKGAENWTAEEQAEVDAGQAIWDQIKIIRAASDALELMKPRPSDLATNDSYWST